MSRDVGCDEPGGVPQGSHGHRNMNACVKHFEWRNLLEWHCCIRNSPFLFFFSVCLWLILNASDDKILFLFLSENIIEKFFASTAGSTVQEVFGKHTVVDD